MNVKKLCRRENNPSNEDCGGIHLSRIQGLLLSSLSGSAPGNVRQCPSLALASLFKTTGDLYSVDVSFRFGLSPLFCPDSFPSAQSPGVVHLMTQEDCQYLLHLSLAGASCEIRRVGTQGHPQGALFSFQGRWRKCFLGLLLHALVCPRFFPIMYSLQ